MLCTSSCTPKVAPVDERNMSGVRPSAAIGDGFAPQCLRNASIALSLALKHAHVSPVQPLTSANSISAS